MAIRKVCGIETEYGIMVRGAESNPVAASSVLINAYVSGEWMAYRQNARVAPQTSVDFGLSVAFPDLRPWN